MGIETDDKNVCVRTGKIKEIEFEVWNNNEPLNYPPVVMVHGMFGGSWYFKNWSDFLCQKGVETYALNLRGHNGSFCLNLGSSSVLDYVQDVKKVVDYIVGQWHEKPIILGHSMGGLIAQKFAEMFPELVAGLVLVASAPPKGISALSPLIMRKMAKKIWPLLFNEPLQMSYRDCFDLVLNNFSQNDSVAVEAAIRFSETPESSRVAKQLAFSRILVDEKKINCPTLVIAGSKDKICPVGAQLKIRGKLHFSDYLQFKCGHMPMIEPGWKKVISKIHDWINLHFIY